MMFSNSTDTGTSAWRRIGDACAWWAFTACAAVASLWSLGYLGG